MKKKVLYTDFGFTDISVERSLVEKAGSSLEIAQCKTEAQVLSSGRDADSLLVQWAPLSRGVIEQLKRCKHIVRIGIGVDNVDVDAASEHGIAVSNVPDYCIDEVADHTLSMALALSRQLFQIDARLRSGTWKITPDAAMPAFREMTFVTIGFGRIARAVLERARAFGFRLAAFDPLVPEAVFLEQGVEGVSLDTAFAVADVLSLHSPLTPETRHLVNGSRLKTMKSNAVIVNTARGGLIDTKALAAALEEGLVGGAGLDVFETEPLEAGHSIRSSPNTILTSHVAWYSQASVPQLQRKAAEEIVRGLLGEPLQNRIN